MRRLAIALLLLSLLLYAPAGYTQDDQPDTAPHNWRAEAEALLAGMSVEERVGQLFLVTFQGDTAPSDSEIAQLVDAYHIGGVSLLAANGNFTGYGDAAATRQQTLELTNTLQQLALLGISAEDADTTDATAPADQTPTAEPTATPAAARPGVPLLIAASHEEDALPGSDIKSGFTALPNNMAIGATWQPANARRVGELAGNDLANAGINLLLGPSLDVLEKPSPLSEGDLGTHSFGGDPYWVGLMGRAYIEGIRAGSNNRLAIASKSFPGKGSSDRPLYEEVPTVRKSLEQLKQIELAPFFAVTRDALGSTTTTDAFLAAHIRYQGFQGNIRATTAPVSLDPQALNVLLTLNEIAPWRQSGGVVVSDALGVRSIERFYDDTEREFPHRQVAKDALLAGNDLLYLADFALGSGDFRTEYANIRDTISWFSEKYQTDPAFQQRADDAVLRLLQLKLRLYGGDFSPENVIITPDVQVPLQPGNGGLADIAQSAVTLLSPNEAELNGRLISPPGLNDRIVIFTDVRQATPCESCPPFELLAEDALQQRIIALYGPDGSNQVRPDYISSFSFTELNEFLAAGGVPLELPTPEPTPTPEILGADDAETTEPTEQPEETPSPAPSPTIPAGFRVQEALAGARWIVFAMLNTGPTAADASNANAVHRFLAERADIVGRTEVVVLAYDAPYFLDTTEVSKLTSFYGVFSKTAPFIDASIRALFQDSPLTGASPVSVESIRYDLFTQTQPDPEQVIELYFVVSGESQSPSQAEPLAAAIGDTLRLATGIIRDNNGRPVPDGTLVRFVLNDRVQGTVTIIGDRPTAGGVAQLDYVLDARMGPGQFRITAESSQATISQEVDIVIEDEAQLAIIVPTAAPTQTPQPTPTATPTPEPTQTPSPVPPTVTPTIPQENPNAGLQERLNNIQAAIAMVAGLFGTGALGVVIGRTQAGSLKSRVSLILWGLVGALLVYNYVALGLPGSTAAAEWGSLGSLAITLVGGLAGLLLYRATRPR